MLGVATRAGSYQSINQSCHVRKESLDMGAGTYCVSMSRCRCRFSMYGVRRYLRNRGGIDLDASSTAFPVAVSVPVLAP